MSSKLKRCVFALECLIFILPHATKIRYTVYMRGCVAWEARVSLEFRPLSVFWMLAGRGEGGGEGRGECFSALVPFSARSNKFIVENDELFIFFLNLNATPTNWFLDSSPFL